MMRMTFPSSLVLLLAAITTITTTHSQRTASIQEVQPDAKDAVHTIWINGPGHTNIAQWIPKDAKKTTTDCTTFDDTFTGYSTTGAYCAPSTTTLDDAALLLVHTGRMGLVLDAAGLDGATASRNLFPKFGAIRTLSKLTPQQVYDVLPATTTDISLTTTCSGVETKYFLGTEEDKFVPIGLVRQGHVMTQLTLTSLDFYDSTLRLFGPCAGFTRVKDPNYELKVNGNQNCNGAGQNICRSAYPDCVGFVQGVSWGRCYSVCTAASATLWGEINVWGDSIALSLKWDAPLAIQDGCTGEITMALASSGTVTASISMSLSSSGQPSAGSEISLLHVSNLNTGSFDNVPNIASSDDAAHQPASISLLQGTTYSGGSLLRRPATRDDFVEVPSNLPRCGYNKNCATLPLMIIPLKVTNSHSTQARTIRLTFSRKFRTRSTTLTQSSQPSAEITGISAQLFTEGLPSGIPCQISKNWHGGSAGSEAKWVGFDGTWWTVNCLLRLPPQTKLPLSLGINYEKYGGISAFSHAQLSIVGYSEKWLWEQAALGTGGENICFDPLGSHTRAFITDVRPKLFDGDWKENVGGGDFLLYWGETGELKYLKSLDPVIRSNGPCLSNASYVSVTEDNAIQSNIEISGGRTDDLVRVFLHQRLNVTKSMKFSRLAFFQFGSETYNYRALFDKFTVGSSGGMPSSHVLENHVRTCSGGSPAGISKASNKMYNGGPFRQQMAGEAPWWISSGANSDSVTFPTSRMVVGDRGLIVRSYDATLGGVKHTSPTFSILCDKIEIGTPAALLELQVGDYVDMKLEIIILPRVGAEFAEAKTNANSPSLQTISSLPTSWERVRAQAEGGNFKLDILLGGRARVESSYPIRVCTTGESGGVVRHAGDTGVYFQVTGTALGYVPVVICGLSSHDIPDTTSVNAAEKRGLWLESNNDGNWVLLNQETSSGTKDFWQVNYDRELHEYEYIYNVEFFTATTNVAFGSRPDTWPNPTCGSFLASCSSGVSHLKSPSTTCAGGTCVASDCCQPNPTCAGFSSCSSGVNHLKGSPEAITCGDATCLVSECCSANPTCAGFSSCSSGVSHLKSGSSTCPGGTCVASDCCELDTSMTPSPANKPQGGNSKNKGGQDGSKKGSSSLGPSAEGNGEEENIFNSTKLGESRGEKLTPAGIFGVVIGVIIFLGVSFVVF